jgi:hypothetical protein
MREIHPIVIVPLITLRWFVTSVVEALLHPSFGERICRFSDRAHLINLLLLLIERLNALSFTSASVILRVSKSYDLIDHHA